MPLDLKSDKPDTAKEPRRFSLNLSPAGLVGAIGLLLVGLAWVFIIGVLVGRGYKPEQAVPELARIMPGANATAQDGTRPHDAGQGVLRAEDLQFYDDLSKKPAPAAKAQPKAEAKPQTPPASKTTAAAKTSAKAEPVPPASTPPAQDDDGDPTVYDYRYQVASVRDQASAKAFQKRLTDLGLSSGLEQAEVKGQTWLRVVVHFRGRPMDTRGLKAKLASLGVDKPIMRDKRKVGEPAANQ